MVDIRDYVRSGGFLINKYFFSDPGGGYLGGCKQKTRLQPKEQERDEGQHWEVVPDPSLHTFDNNSVLIQYGEKSCFSTEPQYPSGVWIFARVHHKTQD